VEGVQRPDRPERQVENIDGADEVAEVAEQDVAQAVGAEILGTGGLDQHR
jgi:hypothetical protein